MEKFIAPTIGFLAVISYTAYSHFYEKVTREVEEPLVSAALLYGIASLILAILAIFAYAVFGYSFVMPDTATLFGYRLKGAEINLWAFALVGCMAVGYYLHIYTEAVCREHMDMGIYSIIFQINLITIVALDWCIYPKNISLLQLLGALLVVFSVIFIVLFSHNINKNRIGFFLIIFSIASSISCGFSLFIDSEISKKIVFFDGFLYYKFSLFLIYEFLTFFIPSVFCLLHLFVFYKSKIKKIYTTLIDNFYNIFLSSLFSVFQFVFSVFALSYTSNRFFVAIILGSSPVVSVIFDRNIENKQNKTYQFYLSVLTMIGISIVLIFQN